MWDLIVSVLDHCLSFYFSTHLLGNRVALNPGLGGMRDVSLMNRLNKTESAVFKHWMLYFQMIYF